MSLDASPSRLCPTSESCSSSPSLNEPLASSCRAAISFSACLYSAVITSSLTNELVSLLQRVTILVGSAGRACGTLLLASPASEHNRITCSRDLHPVLLFQRQQRFWSHEMRGTAAKGTRRITQALTLEVRG
jgi:hypothetical protein